MANTDSLLSTQGFPVDIYTWLTIKPQNVWMRVKYLGEEDHGPVTRIAGAKILSCSLLTVDSLI